MTVNEHLNGGFDLRKEREEPSQHLDLVLGSTAYRDNLMNASL